MTQVERLNEYLDTHNSITPLQSWEELGIYRLGARIFDLKKAGVVIHTRLTPVENRFGEECHVAEYSKRPFEESYLPFMA
jgi:hypothetical protein